MATVDIDRITPTLRPAGPLAGYHTWTDLTFLHWRVPAADVQALLPKGLTVDTYDGDAWVGLVPFYMSNIRPWWAPAVPGLSWFCETNVRTYVHRDGREPGVWFFSLDASNSIAVRTARWGWSLPYYRARMSLSRAGSRVDYASQRLWPGTSGAGARLTIEAGDLLGAGEPDRPRPVGQCVPGTLEHFLIERYILYAAPAPSRLLLGRVYHTPYPVRTARVLHCEQTLTEAAGLPLTGPPLHAAFSDGVQVDVYSLNAVLT